MEMRLKEYHLKEEYMERRDQVMSSPDVLGRVYGIILKRIVATGQAPHYTEIAAAAGLPVEEGRKALHDLIGAGIPAMWLYPETDYICSFAPFSNLGSASTACRNGSANEGSNRWQLAGFTRAKRYGSTLRASIAARPFAWR
jgi:hypothetical protein